MILRAARRLRSAQLGRGARARAGRRARQSHRSGAAIAGWGARPRRRLDQPVRAPTGTSGRSSTWPTRPSCAARSWPRSRHCAASISTAGSAARARREPDPAASGARRAGRGSAGRRGRSSVRPLAHGSRRHSSTRVTCWSTEDCLRGPHGRRRFAARGPAAGPARSAAAPGRRRVDRALRRHGRGGRRQAGRSGGPPESRAGRARPSFRVSPRWVTRWRRAVRPNVRASCIGWTSVRRV